MPNLALPGETLYTVEPGYSGAAAWGIQRGLNRTRLFDSNIAADGYYGTKTEARVSKFQSRLGLGVDGRFGPQTSRALSHRLQDFAVGTLVLPERITYSLVGLESGDLIGAVNWSVSGGVDLSYVQRRVYGPPYDEDAIQRAFDALYQFGLLVKSLRWWHDKFWTTPNQVKTHERAWRLAVLEHNYPSAAVRIAEVGIEGLSSYWTTAQSWVTQHGRTFEDGAPVRTPLEWCQHYALGAPEHGHEGLAVRGVSGWDTP